MEDQLEGAWAIAYDGMAMNLFDDILDHPNMRRSFSSRSGARAMTGDLRRLLGLARANIRVDHAVTNFIDLT